MDINELKEICKIRVIREKEDGIFISEFESKDNFKNPIQIEILESGRVELIDTEDQIKEVEDNMLEEFLDDMMLDNDFAPIEIINEKNEVSIQFEDVTEVDMFDFDTIKEGDLQNREQGLWAYHGERKFKIQINNGRDNLKESDDMNCKSILVFNKKNNDIIPEIRVENIFVNKNNKSKYEEFIISIDTNRLGEEFNGEYSDFHRMEFSGSFQITYSWKSKLGYKERYSFPIKILLHNTNAEVCTLIDKKAVSVDFGTSSTCVAVKEGKDISLLTISSEKIQGVNQFENPTNLMIYRWERLYNEWKNDNKSFPYLLKGTREEERFKEKEVEFDCGYTVKDVLHDANTAELNAVLTQIKLIPYNLQKGEQIEMNPLIKGNTSVVKLVTSPEDQDEESFDPIAFYGYLLGRAINRPNKGKIYTKFDITYPVKFNKEVREKTQKSLEYGLKRSLPIPIREALDKKGRSIVNIRMNYPEPVAYIGSVCGKYLKLEEENKGKLFAVYDFGGGTLDYSFGMFRRSNDDDEMYSIDIYGVDGDETIGGESLIELISFWIYSSDINKGSIIGNGIPFVLPINQKIPDDFPERLITKSGIAKSNIRKLNEIFSRDLFEGNVNISTDEKEIELFDEDGNSININISVDYETLKNKLQEIIEKTIINFKNAMENIYVTKNKDISLYGKFALEDFNIFKAGNSSRSVIVDEYMKSIFSNNSIQLIDEVINNGENKRYAITPKTAVAFGQIKLNDFDVNILAGDGDAPFKWYVGTVNSGNGKYIEKLSKNQPGKDWIRQSIIRGEEVNIYYSGTTVSDIEDLSTAVIEVDEDDRGCELYIRVNDDTSIEYCIVPKGESVSSDKEVNKNNILILK